MTTLYTCRFTLLIGMVPPKARHVIAIFKRRAFEQALWVVFVNDIMSSRFPQVAVVFGLVRLQMSGQFVPWRCRDLRLHARDGIKPEMSCGENLENRNWLNVSVMVVDVNVSVNGFGYYFRSLNMNVFLCHCWHNICVHDCALGIAEVETCWHSEIPMMWFGATTVVFHWTSCCEMRNQTRGFVWGDVDAAGCFVSWWRSWTFWVSHILAVRRLTARDSRAGAIPRYR